MERVWSRLASVSGCHVSVEERGYFLLLRRPTKGTISKIVVDDADQLRLPTVIIGHRLRPGQAALA
ncbi:hypothetical protein P692DRAFT_20719459 [Suillus brevipes Sb2]|jgi:hypothetical protein|nr:hypothetical protein P692DRAFT_20719459 [Suillus brevipes Sb2]